MIYHVDVLQKILLILQLLLPYRQGNHNNMPVYEYKCKKCNTVFDRLIAINDDHIIRCPECDGETKKLISSAGIIFKGSGFYINDYSKKTNTFINK